MITPLEIKERAAKEWNSGRIGVAHLECSDFIPLEMPARPPAMTMLEGEFPAVREWISQLKSQSKEALGRGYSIKTREWRHRRLGKQSMPTKIVIETRDDLLFLAGREREFRRFKKVAEEVLARFPQLKAFLVRKPSFMLEYEEDIGKLLAVCGHFVSNDVSGFYLRQLDIPGVDTKFIERRCGVLAEMLELLLPGGVAQETPGSGLRFFERRFGLKHEQPTVRFRLLDPAIHLSGLRDIAIPLTEFQSLRLPLRKAFIVENKMNGLCFPDVEAGIVIFGMGYGVNVLSGASWLKDLELHYWGDIDTHGFAILDSLRVHFPKLRTFLMDHETLERFKGLWTQEGESQRFLKELSRLNSLEHSLFEALKSDKWGAALRLEQERISHSYFLEKLAQLTKSS